MCLEIEKFANKRFAEGRAEGEVKGKAESICNLMKNAGTDFDTAAKMIGCSEEKASALKPLVDAMMAAEK